MIKYAIRPCTYSDGPHPAGSHIVHVAGSTAWFALCPSFLNAMIVADALNRAADTPTSAESQFSVPPA